MKKVKKQKVTKQEKIKEVIIEADEKILSDIIHIS